MTPNLCDKIGEKLHAIPIQTVIDSQCYVKGTITHTILCVARYDTSYSCLPAAVLHLVNQGPVTSYRKFRGIPCEDPYIALIFGVLLGSSATKPRNKFQNNLKYYSHAFETSVPLIDTLR